MKKGQFATPLAVFLGVSIGIFVVAIVMLYLTNTILDPIQASFGNQSVIAGEAIAGVQTSFTNFWDWAVIIVFLANTILLFVSAFLIDTHPIFVPFYIIACFVLIILANSVVELVDKTYETLLIEDPTLDADLPLTTFIVNNFEVIYLGILILSGVIIYSKFVFFGKRQGGGYT